MRTVSSLLWSCELSWLVACNVELITVWKSADSYGMRGPQANGHGQLVDPKSAQRLQLAPNMRCFAKP